MFLCYGNMVLTIRELKNERVLINIPEYYIEDI